MSGHDSNSDFDGACPRALVVTAPGINCDGELALAFAEAGARPEQILFERLRRDPSLLDDVENYVHCLDYARLRGTLEREGVLKVGLNGHAFELKRGEHLFLSYSEAAAVGGV